jgi:hypothetical protein
VSFSWSLHIEISFLCQDGAAEDLDEDALLKKMIEEQNVEWQRFEFLSSWFQL